MVRAGEFQKSRFGSQIKIRKKGDIDLVTEVDLEIERMFRALIAERFPDHAVLAEEMGETGPSTAAGTGAIPQCRWVFDPLDGTSNYAHGIPIFCSALALEVDGEIVVGAVFDPNRNELYTAERGVGAWLNGERLRVSDTSALSEAMLVTGFPYDVREKLDDYLSLFGEYLRSARAVRRLGSAAIDLCWVAAGRMDAFWERGLKVWDMMAGGLIVQEAGGRVTALDGGPWRPHEGDVLASNGHIHDAMVSIGTAHALRDSR